MLHRKEIAILCIAVAVVAAGFCTLQWCKHANCENHAADLGFMHQAVWTTSNGKALELTELVSGQTVSRICLGKAEIVLFILAPLYLLVPNAVVLMMVQTVVVVSGIIPLYLLARRKTASVLLASALSIAYVINPFIQVNVFHDFHPSVIAIGFMLWMFLFFEGRQWRLFWLFALLTMWCRVDVCLPLSVFGVLVLLFRRGCRIHGLVLSTACVAWVSLNFLVITPWAAKYYKTSVDVQTLQRYGDVSDGAMPLLMHVVSQRHEFIKKLTTRHARLYIVSLYKSTGFTAVAAPEMALCLLPTFLINFISKVEEQRFLYYQYAVPLFPVIFYAGVLGTCRMLRIVPIRVQRLKFARQITTGLVAALLVVPPLHLFVTERNFMAMFPPRLWMPQKRHAEGRKLLSLIPPDARVAAQDGLHPHLSGRCAQMFMFPHHWRDVDYIALDISDSAGKYPLDHTTYWSTLIEILDEKRFGVRAFADGYLVLARDMSYDERQHEAATDAIAAYRNELFNFEVVDYDFPDRVQCLQPVHGYVTIRNASNQIWRGRDAFRVGVSFAHSDWPLIADLYFHTFPLPPVLRPGDTARIAFIIRHAPRVPGKYYYRTFVFGRDAAPGQRVRGKDFVAIERSTTDED